MTIRWVKVDPLVLNGEPFCYGTRLTVRNLVEMRSHGMTPRQIIAEHPELRRVGIAEAFRYAAEHRSQYADFLEPDGSLVGPAYAPEDVADLPPRLQRLAGIVVKAPATT